MRAQFKDRLIGSSQEFMIDQRIFHVICLILLAACLSGIAVNVLIGVPDFVFFLTLAFSVFPISLFYISRYRNKYKTAQNLLLVVGYIFLIIIWFYSSGINGYIHMILFSLLIWQMVFPLNNGYIWMIVNISIALLLAGTEIVFPDMVQWSYQGKNEKVLDFIFTYLIMGVSTFFVVRALIHNYRKEKDAVDLANKELDVLNVRLNSTVVDLENTNQTKDKLFSVISHDIRSFTGTISSFSQLLVENNGFDEKSKEYLYLHFIHDSSTNLNGLLDNLLAWARIQMQSIQVNAVPFNLLDLVNETIALYQQSIKNKNLKVTIHTDADVYAFADLEMIRSVVRNLISNAVKFTHNNGLIDLLIERNALLKTIELSVKDNGTGLTPSEIEQLFMHNSFFSKQGTNLEKGTGLGFNISLEFVEMNHGHIRVESEKGEGSTFTLSLPVK